MQRCRGVAGFNLLWRSFDNRDDVRLAYASGEDRLHLERVTSGFNHVGEVVEWRVTGKEVMALILRLYLDGGPDDVKHQSFLIIAKVRPGASCATQVIDTRMHGDANSRARRFADQAQSAACLWK